MIITLEQELACLSRSVEPVVWSVGLLEERPAVSGGNKEKPLVSSYHRHLPVAALVGRRCARSVRGGTKRVPFVHRPAKACVRCDAS
eukprot:4620485-Pyramimonas_sp.AAC.2